MIFREDVFLTALTSRPETVRMMMQTFDPTWLKRAEYQPILAAIYKFMREFNTPPSITVLHDIFKQKDSSLYDARVKPTLDELHKLNPDVSDILYAIDQAKNVALSRSFMDMVNSPVFAEMNNEFDGKGQMKEVEKWMRKFQYKGGDLDLDFKEAYEELVRLKSETVLKGESTRIPCGVAIIDKWCGGGLRKKNLAIALAPTGHGKSHFLMSVAHYQAVQGSKILFISNELSMEEITERFIARATGTPLQDVMEDPNVGQQLAPSWKSGLHKNLKLLQVNREIDTNEIESLIGKYSFMYGWRPDVIVLDFMERMKPTVTGVKRDQSWNWIGYIAKDLVRMAKTGNWLIWTAGQTNRGGLSRDRVQSLEDAQGSIQHLQEAALVIAFRQKDEYPPENKDNVMLEITPLKMRQSKRPGKSILVEADWSRVRITDKYHDKEEFTEKTEDAGAMPMKDTGKGSNSS